MDVGEGGGSAESEWERRERLKVRVLRLWKQAYQIDMILMDEKGDKIQATVKKVLMCVFENQLEEGSVVLLSKFGVGEMNDKFPFVDLHEIINREVEVESTADVIGYVVSTTDMEVFNRSGKESKRISFEIVNFTYEVAYLLVETPLVALCGIILHNNFPLLFKVIHVMPLSLQPNIQNAFFGSRLFINDDIEEITSFRNRLIEGGQVEGSSQITPASLSSQTVYSSGEEFLKKYERKFVEEIWDVGVEYVFVVLGTIRSVEEDFGWFYVGCSKCSKKVIPASDHAGGLDDIDADDAASDVGVLYCPKCKIRSLTTILRHPYSDIIYKIRVRVQDATGTISFVMFDKDVSKVIGRSARDIHDQQLRDVEDVNSEPASGSFTCFKEAFSFTKDSEVPIDAANDDATSPQAAKRSSDVSKDENGNSSSTKRRLLNVKVEK
ncbi:uncharacterized protein LOC110923955 [Helianthus annuus]|uniref:uncharacterized protein LOC110923955 n=1 Tax=Helianthus annuus TaxID=4232 RepID=UPI000B905AF2|nr:uncharacterized protein LOC110923955 [Helianthus annuus]